MALDDVDVVEVVVIGFVCNEDLAAAIVTVD